MDRDYNKTWLDVYIGIHSPKLRFNQYDDSTQTFLVKITRNEEVIEGLDNALITLVAIKPDKSVEAQFIETQDGFFYADLKPSMRDIPGNYEAKAFIVLDGESIVSDVIRYSVSEDNVITRLNESVVDTKDYSLLTEIIKRLSTIEANENARQEYFNHFKDYVEHILNGFDPNGNFHAHDNMEVLDSITQENINSWNNKADKSNIPTKTSQLINDIGYMTSIPSEYVTESELRAKGYLTSIPSEYVTEDELNAKGYLTEHQDISGKADNLFKANATVPSSLGGINKGDDLNNRSLQDVLTKLLFPYVSPSINSSLILSPMRSLYEYGETVLVTKIITNIVKNSNPIKRIEFLDNDEVLTVLLDGVANGGNFSHTFTSSVPINFNTNSNRFRVKVYDGEKVFTSNTTSITFARPFYYGALDINANIISNSLAKDLTLKQDKSYVFNLNNQCMVMAYPKEYGLLSAIFDINGFNIMKSFTYSVIEMQGLYGMKHEYYVYKSSPSTNTDFKVQFKF